MRRAGRNVARMNVWALFLFVLFALPVRAEPLVVFAAASLKAPLDQLAARHGDTVVSYAGSGALARQIMQGAPADVVVLAHPDWMAALNASGAVVAESEVEVAGNDLVMIGPADAADLPLTADGLRQRLGGGRLAMGFTQAVPAGQYGRAALTHLGLWNDVTGHVAEVDNVRAALVLVARGEAPLGVVYATDALASDAVSVVAAFPPESHQPIRYPAALVRDTPAARAFLALLASPEGQAIFAAAGFTP